MSAFERPRPGPKHEVLKKLTTKWSGEEVMHPSQWSPEEKRTIGSSEGRMLEDFFAVCDYVQRDGDEVTFRGHGVYGYDGATDEYTMHWFDTMGGPGGVARGKFEGNVLTFENESPMGKHRYRYTFEDGRTLFQMSMSHDGGESWSANMDATYIHA